MRACRNVAVTESAPYFCKLDFVAAGYFRFRRYEGSRLTIHWPSATSAGVKQCSLIRLI